MRLETMVAMANLDIPSQFLRRYIASALHIVVQVARLGDGRRKLVSLQEITGMEGDVITMQEVFSFRQTGIDADGKVQGRFQYNGIRPRFAENFKLIGLHLPPEFFDATVLMEI
jgi:pilus assembly protein CpaF